MWTSLTLPTPDGTNLFGRTLDLDTHFGEAPTLTPRRYPFSFADCYPLTHHYALLGMATVMDGTAARGYPLYAEAMNEKGLCMAGLRFAESAVYAPRPQAGFLNLAPWELIPYLLGTCATVAEARACKARLGDPPDLPGDYSSPSRFTRAALLRKWVIEGSLSPQTVRDDTQNAVEIAPHTQFFRILAAVSPMAGAVMTPEGKCHRTLYACCMDTAAGVYRYHTEADPTIRRISFSAQNLNGEAPFIPNPDRISHPY